MRSQGKANHSSDLGNWKVRQYQLLVRVWTNRWLIPSEGIKELASSPYDMHINNTCKILSVCALQPNNPMSSHTF